MPAPVVITEEDQALAQIENNIEPSVTGEAPLLINLNPFLHNSFYY